MSEVMQSETELVPGEQVVFSRRPSAWMILLAHLAWYVMMGLVLAAILAGGTNFLADHQGLLVGLWFTAMLLRFSWDVLDWWFRRYTLTDRRMVSAGGVLRRAVADLPLVNVQYLAMDRSVMQRLVGVGTIAGGTSGRGIAEVLWGYVGSPSEAMAVLRARIDMANPASSTSAKRLGAKRVLVVGLVGGIGSGKSTVAGLLAKRGCAVVDSDAAAREILTREAVRRELVGWWGAGILDGGGNVDRRRVAAIVFADPSERARLEGLVHPLIKAERDRVIGEVAASGGGIVVVDAPLLFEAGVEKECDAVVFVDAPREQRVERVRARGWDESELAQREAAQMPLDEKRRRSQIVIVNDGGLDVLDERVGAAVDGWRRELGGADGR